MISYGPLRRTSQWLPLTAVLAIAAAARLWFLTAGVPHAVGIDEPLVVDHALRILRTGDWNPHIFNYPALVIYLNASVDIVRFLWGAVNGEWASLDGFTIGAVYGAGRFVAALIGVATVWLVYKVGIELGSRRVALLAAAQLAVRPMHVRESHFVLTDVPMAALVTLALWLTLRACRLSTIRAYTAAGAACGLAAAAKYTGGVVWVAVLVAWIIHERSSIDRGRKLAAAAGSAAVAFLIAAPYTWLDLPSFLDGFASLFAQFAGPSRAADPVWAIYAKHLWLDGAIGLTLGLPAVAFVLVRRDQRRFWAPVVAFGATYFYTLSTHSHVFGRYAVPLLPVLCLLSSAGAFELQALVSRLPQLAGSVARRAIIAVAAIVLIAGPAVASVRWLDQLKRADTRTMAADWLSGNAPRGARVAVENSGPTYLDAAGFAVIQTELLFEHDLAWYQARADYLIVSTTDVARYQDLLTAGPTVFQIAPTPQRWGPPILIVSVKR
jgi:4-amino-4-deoxy-L-arabinose transferase-like glycosyltransferase